MKLKKTKTPSSRKGAGKKISASGPGAARNTTGARGGTRRRSVNARRAKIAKEARAS